ncbi:ABC transporter ATP-binding protein, partial [Candidatus Uhrbacteria bacterium CG_4_10_14_0_2_um_filter_41_7]
AIKNFVSQAVVNTVSSIFLIIGGSILLISIDWRLGLAVLTVLPIIAGAFIYIFSKVKTLFTETREVIDALNKVINESVVGSALIRIVNSRGLEFKKFRKVNTQAKHLGIKIVKLFASMIPIITFSSNLAVLIILLFGGKFVINGSMTLGDFASFNSYIVILIFPILILGFVSNIVAQAQASYGRISEILGLSVGEKQGTIKKELKGEIELNNVSLIYGEKSALKEVSLRIQSKSRTAIIGPTAAGKTQLLNLLIGLVLPNVGTVTYDGTELKDFDKENLYKQVGLVFQDSILFNLSLKENIAFSTAVSEEDLQKAIETAELDEFIHTLPNGLETIVSERGTSLSGGQKQRIMLARALSLNPRVLLLDDFTARVDSKTEAKILQNITNNYPAITLVSVTQKISSVEHYDQIIVLMEGEVIASGLHDELLKTSPEYNQIFNSQKSTNIYELQSK